MIKEKKIESILVFISLLTIVSVIIYTEYDNNNMFSSLATIIFWLLWFFIALYSYYVYTKHSQNELEQK